MFVGKWCKRLAVDSMIFAFVSWTRVFMVFW